MAVRLVRGFRACPRLVINRFAIRQKSTSATNRQNVDEAIAENRKCRVDLATAFRGLDRYKMSEGVCTHLTMMAPAASGEGRVMLMIPHGLHWSRVNVNSLFTSLHHLSGTVG